MELYTMLDPKSSWRRANGLLEGLRAAADSGADTLLVSDAAEAELGELLAAVSLYQHCGGLLPRLVVGSAHPTQGWVEALHSAGLQRVVLTCPAPTGRASRAVPSIVRDIPPKPCAMLHTWMSPRGPWSVCGRRGDRLLVTLRRMEDRCLDRWEGCPLLARSGDGASAGSAEAGPQKQPGRIR